MPSISPQLRNQQGLYDPSYEHDACGVAFVVDMHGRPSSDLVAKGLTALRNLDHRGASGSDPRVGDGAGILIQIPDAFLRAEVSFPLPPPGSYAVGMAFLPREAVHRDHAIQRMRALCRQEGLTLLGWREVPTDNASVGEAAREVEPVMRQLFVGGADGLDLERRAFCLRKRAERELGIYFPSLSGRTL